jgi:hypothetical protein
MARKATTLIAMVTFSATVDNEEHIVRKGDIVASDRPAVAGREELFDQYDSAKPA